MLRFSKTSTKGSKTDVWCSESSAKTSAETRKWMPKWDEAMDGRPNRVVMPEGIKDVISISVPWGLRRKMGV